LQIFLFFHFNVKIEALPKVQFKNTISNQQQKSKTLREKKGAEIDSVQQPSQ
jgi:hypothetical protein